MGKTTTETAPLPAIADERLRAVVENWETLPEAVRAGIAAMVASVRDK